MSVLPTLLRVIFFVFLPAALAYLGSEKNIIDILKENKVLGENFNTTLVKQVFQVTSVSLTNLVLVVLYEVKNHREKVNKAKNLSLITDWKSSFLSALASEIGDSNINSLKVRVWKEKKGFLIGGKKFWSNLRNSPFPTNYAIINIYGLSSSDLVNDLYFEVSPSPQGLVGKCYTEGIIEYEPDMAQLSDLNLTPFQTNKTRNTRFCLCFPIFNDRNEIVTIISMESIYNITIPEQLEESVANMVTIFAQELEKYFPKLVK